MIVKCVEERIVVYECFACGTTKTHGWNLNPPTMFVLCMNCYDRIINRHPCPDCGKPIARKAEHCYSCRQKGSRNHMKGAWKKGHIPWNKGTRGAYSDDYRIKLSLKKQGTNNPWYGKKRSRFATLMKEIRKFQILPTKDTKPERIIQSTLKKFGVPFETHVPLDGQPDIFIPHHICIFIDGDYWHANPLQYSSCDYISHGKVACEIWARDAEVTRALESQGYVVIRLWESDIYDNIDICINKIVNEIILEELA